MSTDTRHTDDIAAYFDWLARQLPDLGRDTSFPQTASPDTTTLADVHDGHDLADVELDTSTARSRRPLFLLASAASVAAALIGLVAVSTRDSSKIGNGRTPVEVVSSAPEPIEEAPSTIPHVPPTTEAPDSTPATTSAPPEPTTYVIQAGDLPGSVAERFGVDAMDIVTLNNMRLTDNVDGSLMVTPGGGFFVDGRDWVIGQTILIPPVTASATPAPNDEVEHAGITLEEAAALLPTIVPLDDPVSGEQVLVGDRVVELVRTDPEKGSLCIRSTGPTPDGTTTDILQLCLPFKGTTGLTAGSSGATTTQILYLMTSSEVLISSEHCDFEHLSDAGVAMHACVFDPRDAVVVHMSFDDVDVEVAPFAAGPTLEEPTHPSS